MVKTKDLRAMTNDQLEEKLVANKKEQFNLRIQQSTGQLQNTSNMKKVRREVAKINTLLAERKKNSQEKEYVVVSVERQVVHPVYKKIVKKSKKFAAHDENNQCKVGDRVSIQECRPISKNKSWTVISDNAQ